MATVLELGQKVKAKYPAYADLPDEEVGRKVKAKYPKEYSDFEDAPVTPKDEYGVPITPERAEQRTRAAEFRLSQRERIAKPTGAEERETKRARFGAELERTEAIKRINALRSNVYPPGLEDLERRYKYAPDREEAARRIELDLEGQGPGEKIIRGATAGAAATGILPLYGAVTGAISPTGTALEGAEAGRRRTTSAFAQLRPGTELQEKTAGEQMETIGEAAGARAQAMGAPDWLAAGIGAAAEVVLDPLTLEDVLGKFATLRKAAVGRRQILQAEEKAAADLQALVEENLAAAKTGEIQRKAGALKRSLLEKRAEIARGIEEADVAVRAEAERGGELAGRLERRPEPGAFGAPEVPQTAAERGQAFRTAQEVGAEEAAAVRAGQVPPTRQEVMARILAERRAKAAGPREPLPPPSMERPPEPQIVIAEGAKEVPTPLAPTRGISPSQRRSQAMQALGIEEPPLVGEIPPGTVSGERTLADIDRIVEAHGRLEEAFGRRIGARGRLLPEGQMPMAGLNWEALGNDLVAATRHIAAKAKSYLEYAVKVAGIYGEKVKPFLEKAWRTIKAKGAGAAGFRPTLPASARQFMGEVQSRQISASSKMRTTLEDSAKGLTSQEKAWLSENFYDTFRSGGSAPAEMPGAQKYMDAWRSVSTPTPGAYKAAGREIGTIENYVPQVWTDEFRNAMARQKGGLYEAWIDDVKRLNPEISAEQIQEISDRIASEVKRGAGRGESFTKGRFFKNMPSEVTVGGEKVSILEKDPFKLARNYSENVGRNLTKQQVAFEKGYKTFSDLESEMRSTIRREHGEQVSGTFTEQMKSIHGEVPTGGIEEAYRKIAPISNIAKGLKLTTTALPNVVQGYIPLIAKAGPKQFAKTVARMVRGGAKEQIEFGRRAGAWSERYLEDMAGGITGEGVASRLARAPVKWTGGEAANRGINKVASVLADDMLKSGDAKLIRRIGETANFSEERIRKILAGTIDDADRAQAMQYLAAKTNNSLEFATEVSRFYQNPIARDALLFSGITRTLGTATLDAIVAARKGDIGQLATLLGLGIPAAYGTQEIRQWLNGRDRYSKMDNGERLFEAILQTGLLGMLGYHTESVKYAAGAKGPQDFLENLWVQYMPPAMDLIGVPIEMMRRGNAKPLRAASPIADIIAVQFFGEKPLGKKPEQVGAGESPNRLRSRRRRRTR